MANRYWVGGTGTWNTSSTTNWSASSGGASGASVPASTDAVFFDQAGTYTVTLTGALNCNDFTVSAGTVTFSSTGSITITGAFTLTAGTVWSATGTLSFTGTGTTKFITTNGVSVAGRFFFNASTGNFVLGSALTTTSASAFTVNNGTFSTSSSNYALNATAITISNGTLNLNASTVTCSAISGFTYNNGTVSAGGSTLNLQYGSFSLGNGAYGTVNFSNGNNSVNITGNTSTSFSTLTFQGRTTAGNNIITFQGASTITTLTIPAGTDATCRTVVTGSLNENLGTAATLNCSTISALSDVDFKDITVAGAASPVSGTRLGNLKGNSGITFTAAKTVYWNLAGAQNWNATGWATSSGGSPAINNFPLAQDTAVFDNTGSVTGTIDASSNTGTAFNIGTIDMSARTTAMTLAIGGATYIYGDFINGSGTTLSGTNTLYFGGRITQNITSSGKTFTQNVIVNSPSGTFKLIDNFSISSYPTLRNGTIDLNGNTFTCSLSSQGMTIDATTNNKNITFNGGTLTLAQTGVNALSFYNLSNGNFTTTAGTGTGTINFNGSSAKYFDSGAGTQGGAVYNCTINQGGAGVLTITGTNTFNDFTATRIATAACSVLFTAGTTTTFNNWSASGAAGKLLTIGSVTAASHTLSKSTGTVSADYLSISRSTATGGATWYAGANSTNGGNNTGWIFSGPVTNSGNFLLMF